MHKNKKGGVPLNPEETDRILGESVNHERTITLSVEAPVAELRDYASYVSNPSNSSKITEVVHSVDKNNLLGILEIISAVFQKGTVTNAQIERVNTFLPINIKNLSPSQPSQPSQPSWRYGGGVNFGLIKTLLVIGSIIGCIPFGVPGLLIFVFNPTDKESMISKIELKLMHSCTPFLSIFSEEFNDITNNATDTILSVLDKIIAKISPKDGGKNTDKHKYNGKMYKVHIGPKGGKFINVTINGKKEKKYI
jgi:hypothetical protein